MNRNDLIKHAGKFFTVDLDDPTSIHEYTLVDIKGDIIIGSCSEYQNERFSAAFCWPIQVKDDIISLCTERARLKKAYDDSMSLVYQLANKIARGEIGP